ncbi:hypothetical protein M8J75_012679 [Diaphorina citri]|nr:hypothetical protein M8J75_012679 [Diaphorina citri]
MIRSLCVFRDLTNGLRNLKVTVPTAVVSGGSCILECTYDLEGDLLYSVKWFRGKTEFYRFVPKEIPPTRTFASSGITVDSSYSRGEVSHKLVD